MSSVVPLFVRFEVQEGADPLNLALFDPEDISDLNAEGNEMRSKRRSNNSKKKESHSELPSNSLLEEEKKPDSNVSTPETVEQVSNLETLETVVEEFQGKAEPSQNIDEGKLSIADSHIIEDEKEVTSDDSKIQLEQKEIISKSVNTENDECEGTEVTESSSQQNIDQTNQDNVEDVPETSSKLPKINFHGNRKFGEITVETFSKGPFGDENISSDDLDAISFFSGNHFIERTSGIMHFYKRSGKADDAIENCSMLCMIGVPSVINCPELLMFTSPCFELIQFMKIVRYAAPNQYMDGALKFYQEYNGIRFNQIEPDRCSLAFVERIDSVDENKCDLPDSFTELPPCTVCLERLDDKILTVLCNHNFHSSCLKKWADTTCPVCRYHLTPEFIPDQKCSECGKTTDLWICLICGNIGCGRYSMACAKKHFMASSHTYALEVGSNLVWDYVGDTYVHRLAVNIDLKPVEVGSDQNDGADTSEKLQSITMEYSHKLTDQLQVQREYFEEKLIETTKNLSQLESTSSAEITNLKTEIEEREKKFKQVVQTLKNTENSRKEAIRKLVQGNQKLKEVQRQLVEEKEMVDLLRSNQNALKSKVETVEAEKEEVRRTLTEKVNDLNEQIQDMMLHFDTKEKLQEVAKAEGVKEEDLVGGSLTVSVIRQQSNEKSKRRGRRHK